MTNRSRTVITALAILASAWSATAQVPLGSEFHVNTLGGVTFPFTFSGTTPRTATMGPDGSFIVAWVRTSAANPYDIVTRRFDASGTAEGLEFVVNTYTTGWQYDPSVGVDDTGNFVVVWTSQEQDGSYEGVFGQRFDASGTRRGGEFRVNSTTFSRQLHPSLAVAPGGDFVVVWISPDADNFGIFGQRYDSSGTPAGGEFQINTYTTSQQYVPSVDMDNAGNFVVVWTNGGPGVEWGTYGQRFTASGLRQGGEIPINSDPFGVQSRARMARGRDGSFVVAWKGSGLGDVDGGIYARRFDPNGVPIGADFRVNEYTTGAQIRPEVDVDADGDFVITWSSRYQDGNGYGVFGRRFDATGAAGAEFKVNTYAMGSQWLSSVAIAPAGNFIVTWHSSQGGFNGVFAQRYAGSLAAAALAVDSSAGPTSDGNGVFEAGETVAVAPAWVNGSFGAQTFGGTVSTFTGPGGPADPTYTIADGTASYGTVASGSTASCTAAFDCYTLGIAVPSARPVQHWHANFREEILPAILSAPKTWSLHVGGSFADVPRTSGFYRFVETLLHHSITGGCNATQYCPSTSTTREQMAVFVLVAKEDAGYAPPACTTPIFNDVPASSPFCRWIEELARRGVVSGCDGANYCPGAPVSREQMAVFVLLTKEPGVTPPACGTPVFNDVPASNPFCHWIEELARRGVVAGCGGGNYCPAAPVTREQMAVFISATFGLLLYGP